MKINCGPTWGEYLVQQAEWHDHFTFIPRRVGQGDCRWLEVIQRKRTRHWGFEFCYWHTEYRAKPTEAKD